MRGLLCNDYKEQLDKASSELDLVKIASSAEGIRTFFKAMNLKNVSIDSSFIKKAFNRYINNGYLIDNNGYTSELYIDCKCDNVLKGHVIGLYNCTGTVTIEENRVCALITMNCDLDINSSGKYIHYVYNDRINKFINEKTR